MKSKNHMKVQSTSSFTVKSSLAFLGRIKFELAMLSSLLILISHSPVEESIQCNEKKYVIQELNCDWINKASVFKVAKRSQSMWGVLKQISFEVTLQTLKILFTCTVTLTCGAWPTVPKTEMNNPIFEWNLETNNELNFKIIKFTLFSSQGCLTR